MANPGQNWSFPYHMEQKDKPEHLKTGAWGEEIACRYLVQKGYKIIERNFRRKCGEIDIICSVAEKNEFNDLVDDVNVPYGTKIVFVEVKTMDTKNNIQPEDNMTYSKQKKIIRACKLYLSEKDVDLDSDWQVDVVAIDLDKEKARAKIRHLENALFM